MKQLFSFLLLFACSGALWAQGDVRTRGAGADQGQAPQTRRITGRVIDAAGQPVAGATVAVVERSTNKTITGTYTDANGGFAVEVVVPSGTFLRITSVGYATQTSPLGESNAYSFTLQEEVTELNTVEIKTAYGSQLKKDLTSSVATLDGGKLTELPVQSFDGALAGRLTGVYVNQQDGLPNNTAAIRIRGVSSITGSSSPLIVVDGTPINTGDNTAFATRSNALGDIPVGDIESYTVQKDAAATALYGSRAAAGVILITTKRGRVGKPRVNYDGWVGFTEAFRQPTLLNAAQFVQIKNEGRRNMGLTEVYSLQPAGVDRPYDIDWQKELFRTGFQQNHTLSVSGSSENGRFTYFISLNHSDQNGYLLATRYRRNQGRINVDYKVNDWLKVGVNLNVSGSSNQNPQVGADNNVFASNNLARQAWILYPTIPFRLPNGDYNINPADGNMNVFGQPNYGLGGGQGNPFYDIEVNRYTNENLRVIGQVFAEIEVPWVKGLTFRSQYGLDNSYVRDFQYLGPRGGGGFGFGGQVDNSFFDQRIWNWNSYFSYNRVFAEKHNVSATLGHEAQYDYLDQFTSGRRRVNDPFFATAGGQFIDPNTAAGAFAERGLVSVFGRVNYGFNNKYLISANFRRDGLSLFQAANRWGNFYGFGAGWNISEEAFFKSLGIEEIDFLKFRGSWGQSGNVNISGGFYPALPTYVGGLYGVLPGLAVNVVDTDLRWETSKKTDIGLELEMFKGRLRVEFDYYENLLDGLILSNPQAPSKGFGITNGNVINQNIGSMRNRGIELLVSGDIIRSGEFRWNSSVNLTTQHNEVVALNQNNDDILSNASGALESISITRVGESIASFFTTPWVGVNPANGLAMFQAASGRIVQYNHAATFPNAPVNPDGVSRPNFLWSHVDDGTAAANPSSFRTVSGQPLPTFYGGWDNTFSWRGIELTVLVRYSGGNQRYAGSVAQWQDARSLNNYDGVLDRWTAPGQVTSIPIIRLGDNVSNGSSFAISKHVYDADFIRIQQIQLAYNFPASFISKLKLSSLRVYGTVNNAFIFTTYPGVDPESNIAGDATLNFGLDRNGLPQPRTYSFGLNIGF